MPIVPLDLKKFWTDGQTYADWLLSITNQHMIAEIERYRAEIVVPDAAAALIKGLTRTVHVLAIIEDWCGDVRRNAPVLAKLCELNPEKMALRCVDKATKPDLMVRYLTNAAEAIPIFLFLNETFVEVGNWGPRPAACKRMMACGKAAGQIDAAREKIHFFYESDRHQSAIRELCELIEIASTQSIAPPRS